MTARIAFQRSLSLGVAGLITLAMLAGVDGLAQRADGPMQWAQTAPVRA